MIKYSLQISGSVGSAFDTQDHGLSAIQAAVKEAACEAVLSRVPSLSVGRVLPNATGWNLFIPSLLTAKLDHYDKSHGRSVNAYEPFGAADSDYYTG
jgi:hypothetical protein